MKMVPNRLRPRKGLTLIEITLVMAVLLCLISVLYLGASEFKNGSNRAICIQNVVHIQKATRAYCNMNHLEPGNSTTILKESVIDNVGFFPAKPLCPSGGTYSFVSGEVPAMGVAFATCSLTEHEPLNTSSW